MRIKITYVREGSEDSVTLPPGESVLVKPGPAVETGSCYSIESIHAYDGTHSRQGLRRVVIEVVS